MDLSVVIPCFNEEETVDVLLKRVDAACKDAPVKTYEIICINDGSTDDTKNLLENNKNLFSTFINNNKNSGDSSYKFLYKIFMDRWPNWIRREATDFEIIGSTPIGFTKKK